eukprot:3471738-Pyramimonas_sp.AAC.3
MIHPAEGAWFYLFTDCNRSARLFYRIVRIIRVHVRSETASLCSVVCARQKRIYPGHEPTARANREYTRGTSQPRASRENIWVAWIVSDTPGVSFGSVYVLVGWVNSARGRCWCQRRPDYIG